METDREITTTQDTVKEKIDEKVKGTHRRRWLGSLFTEGESDAGEGKSLSEAVRAMHIDGRWFFRQIRFLLFILFCILLMVTNRYQAQQEIIEKEQLQHDVEEWRYKALTRSSELTTLTRQSQIEEQLKFYGDSTLTAPKEPPFTINPNE